MSLRPCSSSYPDIDNLFPESLLQFQIFLGVICHVKIPRKTPEHHIPIFLSYSRLKTSLCILDQLLLNSVRILDVCKIVALKS
jgi:hypothetical protein